MQNCEKKEENFDELNIGAFFPCLMQREIYVFVIIAQAIRYIPNKVYIF